jgi:hypothetical protein
MAKPVLVRLMPLVPIMVALVLACNADRIILVPPDSQSRTVLVAVGQEFRVTLGNVGPAQYESPPQISSAAVMFLGVDVIPPFTPAGPTQQFRFKAISPGQSIIHFRRLLGESVVSFVEDTIRIK